MSVRIPPHAHSTSSACPKHSTFNVQPSTAALPPHMSAACTRYVHPRTCRSSARLPFPVFGFRFPVFSPPLSVCSVGPLPRAPRDTSATANRAADSTAASIRLSSRDYELSFVVRTVSTRAPRRVRGTHALSDILDRPRSLATSAHRFAGRSPPPPALWPDLLAHIKCHSPPRTRLPPEVHLPRS